MIALLREWAVNIVIIAVFITFIEIILPSSSMKKYIKVILGFVVIIVIINPFINLIKSNIDIDKEIFLNFSKSINDENIVDSRFIENNNQKITEIYKSKIKSNIINLIKEKTEFSAKEVFVEINSDINSKEFGSIKNIGVVIDEKLEVEQNDVNITIEEIKICIGHVEKTYKKTVSEEYDLVKDIISKEYKIQKDNIFIYLSN